MIQLNKTSTLPPDDAQKKEYKKKLKKVNKKLFRLQNKFYADGRYGLLIILQGMDTSGKDGIIRHVIRSMNPMGVNIKSFGVPTAEEMQHDFLWRIYPHLPAKTMIQVFNRSYYEDILVPKITKSVSAAILEHRFELINMLESHLELNNIKVLKFFLHISRDEQLERIEERKTKENKMWKYDKSDEYSKEKWDASQEVYETLLNRCQKVPWHIIPADKRWYRNYKTAKTIKEYIKDLQVEYPSEEVLGA